jgi:hypothetical protein
MSALICDPPIGASADTAGSNDDTISAQVWGLLAGMFPAGSPLDRRHEQRYAYPRLVMLTPVQADGQTPDGPTFVAAGKQLSERGLGFFHPQPLVNRLVIASLETADGRWLGFLLDIRHCRFARQGWYESGGRFLRTVASPMTARDAA